ncbi:MAG: hypothetical protein D6767_05895, partial [Candidatus Hydrogenedentota bacterium]
MVAIIIALFDEAYELVRTLSFQKKDGVYYYYGNLQNKKIAVFLCKPRVSSLNKVRRFLSLYPYEAIVNIGFAGSLKPYLQQKEVYSIYRIQNHEIPYI